MPLAILLTALVPASPASGQAAPRPPANPGAIVRYDGIVDVSTVPPRAGPWAAANRAKPYRVPDPDRLRAGKEQADSLGLPVPEGAPRLEPSLGASILTSFIGLRFSEGALVQGFGVVPPDTQVAAGPDHIFEGVNVVGRILTKSGTAITTFRFADFFDYPASTPDTDPKVRFDPVSNRWFVAIVTDEATLGTWRLAVSTTSDPTGTFVRYAIQTPGSFPDFPAIGISDDKVILTANAFGCTTACDGPFLGTEFIVFRKADLLTSNPNPGSQFFGPPQGLFTIQPAHSLSSTSPLFMAAVNFFQSTTIRIWSVTGVPGTGPGVTATTVDRAIGTLLFPPDAIQPATARRIETNDNRLLDAVYRDGSFWVAGNAGCVPIGDAVTRACMRFTQISTSDLSVSQDFNFGGAGLYYYYPAIQTDSANGLIAVFSRSSASEFASVYAGGRLASDPPNRLQAAVLVKAGENAYMPFANRWGDYSGAGIDPLDPTTVWVAGEYARVEGGSEWGTWIAKVMLGPAPVPSLTISPPSGSYVTTQGFDLVLIVDAGGLSLVGGTATLDGADVGAALVSCLVPGTLVSGGVTLRCPDLTGGLLGAGTHTLSITLHFNDGSTASHSVTWEIRANVEP